MRTLRRIWRSLTTKELRFDMKEVEVKAKVRDKEGLLEALGREGVGLSEPITQIDHVYARKDLPDFVECEDGEIFLRIREQKGKLIFTLKQPQNNDLVCTEHELEIGNKEEMHSIMEIMGYEKKVEVVKTRQKARFRKYEICVDEVEGLGSYVELEEMTDDDPNAAQYEMFKLLESLGITKDDRVLRGYDVLVYLESRK